MSVDLDAVRGRLMAEKSRSLAARLITKAVVAWARSFWHRSRATTVNRLPAGEAHYTVSFSKDVFSQEAVNWVFLGLFH